MIKNFKLVKVDYKYCDYLSEYDERVPYNRGIKDLRPFIGILFEVDGIEYFAPLSSPKEKHKKLKNTMDLVKIDNGRYGVINFNNMIPVTNKNYIEFDLYSKPGTKQEFDKQNLLKTQLKWLNDNKKNVLNLISRWYYGNN